MNQLYRALHMPPARLARKLAGEKELYTVALRPRPDSDCLPAMGAAPFTPLPFAPGVWYADPLLYTRDDTDWLFCEAFDMAAGRGAIAAFAVGADGTLSAPQTVLTEPFHLSFPTVFDWNGETWMIPETGDDRSVILYRCAEFPHKWERAVRFEAGAELCDTILLDQTPETLTLLCSEVKPDNGFFTRWRRRILQKSEEGLTLTADDAFDLRWREYGLGYRNAGPLFAYGGQTVHAAQISTRVDYGVSLQFFVRGGANGEKETPLCAVGPRSVTVTGVDGRNIIGIHTYCRNARWEVIDLRVLRRPLPPGPAPEPVPGS